LARLYYSTSSTEIHTYVTKNSIPHEHERGSVVFRWDLDEKQVIDLGFEVSADESIVKPWLSKSAQVEAILIEANFEPMRFLALYKAAYEKERVETQAKKQMEEQQAQRLKEARSILEPEFKELEQKITRLNEAVERRDKRVEQLASVLRQLIRKANDEVLEAVGLYNPSDDGEDQEEPELTEAQQEALETLGLDDC